MVLSAAERTEILGSTADEYKSGGRGDAEKKAAAFLHTVKIPS